MRGQFFAHRRKKTAGIESRVFFKNNATAPAAFVGKIFPKKTCFRELLRDYSVISLITVLGLFSITEAIPLSRPLSDEYISLLPMIWPFAALRTK